MKLTISPAPGCKKSTRAGDLEVAGPEKRSGDLVGRHGRLQQEVREPRWRFGSGAG
jgi:hypothetical protein